ncbi:MAG: SurA N-terminal domain-containing protein [Clostridia bacterium]|nr:SurA N-terminal domain-containing protein [Clostridia bacterium]
MANVYGKKKTTRNILIGVIAALVIAAAIFLAVALQKDGAGMNCFQRSATAASANGERISVAEYRVMYDMTSSQYTSTTLTDGQIRNMQEYCAKEVLKQKIYPKEAKALGLSLTDEQIAAAANAADEQVASIEKYYADSLISGGNYSKATLEKQVDSYFQRLGMSKNAYRAFLKENAEGEYYHQAIENYYKENGSGIDEDTLVAYYRKSVEDSMKTVGEDGTETETYSAGMFWNYLMMYQIGYSSPMLYVPEGFIYVDFIQIQKGSTEEVEEIIRKVNDGEMSFDELMQSEDNQDTYKNTLTGPYPIAENDHAALFSPQELYNTAAALEVGEIGSFVGQTVTDDDGNTTVTGYLVRRAEGNMCYDGDHGVIKLDYFPGIRESAEEQYRLDQLLADIKYEDIVYAYKGALG